MLQRPATTTSALVKDSCTSNSYENHVIQQKKKKGFVKESTSNSDSYMVCQPVVAGLIPLNIEDIEDMKRRLIRLLFYLSVVENANEITDSYFCENCDRMH